MAIQAKAEIILRGGPQALKTLQGIKRETNTAGRAARDAARETDRWQRLAQKSADARMRAEQKAAREAIRAAQQTARAKQKAHQDAARAADKSARDSERAAQREADRWQKLAQKAADERIRQQQRATQAAQREAAKQAAAEAQARRDSIRRAGGAIGAVTAGALAGAGAAMSTARGISGVKDVRERITSANEFRERLVLTTNQAGMSAQEREATQARVLDASRSTGKDIGELMGVLETGQAQFNNLKFFADNIGEIAKLSKAAGADTGEFATALGYAQQAFGLTGDEAMEAAYLMKASADKGSVELSNFARDFAASAGIFAMNSGQKGMAGVRSFLGAAQGVATGGFGSAESATRLERFITDINDVEVQKGLKGIGVTGFVGSDGKVDVGNLIKQLGSNQKFKSAATRQDIFKEVRSLQAVEALVAAQGRVQSGVGGAIDFDTISRVDAQAGRDATTAGFKAMQSEGFFRAQQQAADMQADSVEKLAEFNEQVGFVTDASNRLEKAFGTLSVWASSIAAAGVVGAGTSLAGKLLGGGKAAAGAAGAAGAGGALAKSLPSVAKAGGAITGAASGALALGSTAVGAASGAAIAGTIGIGLAAGGALGYGLDKGVEAVTGKGLSDRLADLMFQMVHGNRELVTETKETNRKLAQLDQSTRAAGKPGANGANREPR
jgi:hypothetical protein